ncbi:MAG: hypothetical protein ACKVIH_12325 [Burkholderiales bacterium]
MLAVLPGQAQTPLLNLDGYTDAKGAISVQHKGDTIDPYFTLQALLLARDNGLDISTYAKPWVNWLVERQKPDATFDRFCRNGPVWAPCKTADADDALLALWLKFLDTMPEELTQNPAWLKSYQQSAAALARLLDTPRGIYLVSPVYQHGLFMDNLEVLSYQPALSKVRTDVKLPSSKKLSRDIHNVFWDPKDKRFLVSTQPEQKNVPHTFYPEYVAQLFPLLFDFKLLGLNRNQHYQKWMRDHRAEWLTQSKADFSWGLVAVIAARQGDRTSAACWLRETASAKNTSHWIVTDTVAAQILARQGISAAKPDVACQ